MYAGAAVAPLEELLSEDVVWHVPGTSPISGEHRGREAVLEYFLRRRELAGGTMRVSERGQLEGHDVVVQLADGTATIGGQTSSWRTAGLYRVAGGRLVEAWLVPADLAAFDAIWNQARSGGGRRAPALTPGAALMALAGGHALWGLVAYRDGWAGIARAGVRGSVGDGLFEAAHADDERAAAFWFMVAAPLIGTIGRLVQSAERTHDRRTLTSVGAALAAVSALGATVIPRSGFAGGVAIGLWTVRRARRYLP